jgi:hypothetical protein
VTPKGVARVVAFLDSGEAQMIVGKFIVVAPRNSVLTIEKDQAAET